MLSTTITLNVFAFIGIALGAALISALIAAWFGARLGIRIGRDAATEVMLSTALETAKRVRERSMPDAVAVAHSYHLQQPIHVTNGNKPTDLDRYTKTATIELQWMDEPFTVRTLEGTTHDVGPETEEWEEGYWIAWPDDGTDPYPIAPSFVRGNYAPLPKP